jgi:hypothetical protein
MTKIVVWRRHSLVGVTSLLGNMLLWNLGRGRSAGSSGSRRLTSSSFCVRGLFAGHDID